MSDDELKRELPPAAEQVGDPHVASTSAGGVAPTPRSALGPSAKRQHHVAMQANYGNAAVLRHVDAQRATADILEAAKKGIGDAERGHDAQKDWMERVRGQHWYNAGVLSDFFNDVTPPSIEAWNSAKHTLAAAEREAKQGSIKNAYMYLRQGYQSLVDAQRQWGAYTKGSVAGAEHTVATLRTIRDGAIAVEVGLATGGLAYAAVGSGVVGATTAALLGTGVAAKTATKFDSPLGEAARGTEHELSLMSGREKLRLAAYGIYGMVMGAGKFLSNVPHGIKVTIEGIGKLLGDLGSDTITGEGKFKEDVDRFRQSLEDLWSQRDELVTWFEHMEPEQQAKAVGQFFGSIEGTIALSGLSQAVGKGLGESNLGVSVSAGGGFGSAGRNVAVLGAAAKRFVSLKPLIQALTPALAPAAVGAGVVGAAGQIAELGEGNLYRKAFDYKAAAKARRGDPVPQVGKGPPQKIGGRMPINSKYAGKLYPMDKLPKALQRKYPKGVRFTEDGFPDFRPYADRIVQPDGITGEDYHLDFTLSDAEAGEPLPDDMTWHHHQDGKTMLRVPRDLHWEVKHSGGVATTKAGQL